MRRPHVCTSAFMTVAGPSRVVMESRRPNMSKFTPILVPSDADADLRDGKRRHVLMRATVIGIDGPQSAHVRDLTLHRRPSPVRSAAKGGRGRHAETWRPVRTGARGVEHEGRSRTPVLPRAFLGVLGVRRAAGPQIRQHPRNIINLAERNAVIPEDQVGGHEVEVELR